jgi:hypothetical protein
MSIKSVLSQPPLATVPVTHEQLGVFLQALVDANNRLAARVEAIETRGIEHVGTWQRAAEYRRGMVVTHNGTSWVCIKGTEPGDAPGDCSNWQLALRTDPPAPPKSRTTVKKTTRVLEHDAQGRIAKFETTEEVPR